MPRKPRKRKTKAAIRVQYGALPYRFTPDAALEILIVTTRQTRRWIVPKGWPIKSLGPSKTAAREAFEEAGVTGRIGVKPLGTFTYDKALDETGREARCEVKVFPLLVKRQSESFPGVRTAHASVGRTEPGGRARQGARAQETDRRLRKAGRVRRPQAVPVTIPRDQGAGSPSSEIRLGISSPAASSTG